VAIFQAPMASQPMIQPAMTVAIAQLGMGGSASCSPPFGLTMTPPTSTAGFSWTTLRWLATMSWKQ
jgi:hypothetical protein